MRLKTLLIVAVLMTPILFAQKKGIAAQKKPQIVHVDGAAPVNPGSPTDSPRGEPLDTPKKQLQPSAADPRTTVPSPREYPFSEALDTLYGVPPHVPAPRLTGSATPQTGQKKGEVPKGYRPQASATPTATAKDAVAISDRWQNSRDTPVEGRDGRVVFSDGGGLPTVICAPLRLCIIELQAGEKLAGEPQIGDSVRWSVEPASYGPAELTTPLLVIKPKAVGLDTNLLITTDRRSYYLRLVSSPQDYVAKVSFDYPDDGRSKWASVLRKQEQEAREAQYDKGVKTLVDSVEALNENYRITGHASIRPVRVLDDGVHTYLRMNPEVLHREAPVLAVLGPDGKAEMVNYRVQGSVYVVDRLFDRGRLILGSGRKAQKADIVRASGRDRRWFARDPFRKSDTTERSAQGNDK